LSTAVNKDDLRVQFLDSIEEIEQQSWRVLASDAGPFLQHEFLRALENTGCTSRETGWQPYHVAVRDARNSLVAVMPLYQKFNSYGEYVFDWSWADAYRSNGIPYYPKFLTAIPFTPSLGPRILVDEQASTDHVVAAIVEAVLQRAEELEISSWHVLFPTEQESELLASSGLKTREGCQFHWFNRGYQSFDDFLTALNSRKRKNIRKERQAVAQQGIHFTVVEGSDIDEKLWKHFYAFYQSTYMIRGMQGYLSEDFFFRIAKLMPDNLFLVLAKLDQQVIAGALFFRDDRKLYGRYWGSLEDFQFLHFETCFYQGIDYCIKHGLQQFDAGAQGEHKIQRGFEPIRTLSNHWIGHPGFARAVDDFLEREQVHMSRYRQEAGKLLPFKKSDQ
jgi:predicted N-acyltransferase